MKPKFDYDEEESILITANICDEQERKKLIIEADSLVKWVKAHKLCLESDLLEALEIYNKCNLNSDLDSRIREVQGILSHKYLDDIIMHMDENEMSKYIDSLFAKVRAGTSLWNKILIYRKIDACLPFCNRSIISTKFIEEDLIKFVEQSKPYIDLMHKGAYYFDLAKKSSDYKERFVLLKKAVACYEKLGQHKIDCSKKLDVCNAELDSLRRELCSDAVYCVDRARDQKYMGADFVLSNYERAIEYYKIAMDIRESQSLYNNYNMVNNEYEIVAAKFARKESFRRGLKEFFEGMKKDIIESLKFNPSGTRDNNPVKTTPYTSSSSKTAKTQTFQYEGNGKKEDEVDEHRKLGDECYAKAKAILPLYSVNVYESDHFFKDFDKAESLLHEAISEYKCAEYYKERRDDIQKCVDKLKFIGECYVHIADQKVDSSPYYETEQEEEERYDKAMEYYEIAESYGYYCHRKKERCKNRRK